MTWDLHANCNAHVEHLWEPGVWYTVSEETCPRCEARLVWATSSLHCPKCGWHEGCCGA